MQIGPDRQLAPHQQGLALQRVQREVLGRGLPAAVLGDVDEPLAALEGGGEMRGQQTVPIGVGAVGDTNVITTPDGISRRD